MYRVSLSFLALLIFCAAAHAEVLELEGTVKAVDATARSITIERKTPKGTKTLELEVTKKAGDLSGVKAGDSISFSYDPDLEIVTALVPAGDVAAASVKSELAKGKAVDLLAGKGLEGWQLSNPLPDPNWLIADGVLVCTREGSDLATEATFDDFEMSVEFMLPAKCNSGIFLRDRYEIQLLDSLWRDQKNQPVKPGGETGALWGIAPPKVLAYVGPSRWNKLEATVIGNKVSARLNGKLILDDVVVNPSGDPVAALGPIRVQCTMVTGMKFRNWVVTPLSEKE